MTVATMKSNTWTYTCKMCSIISKALTIAFMAIVAFGESAGRARAAAELSRQGFHEEARALMLDRK